MTYPRKQKKIFKLKSSKEISKIIIDSIKSEFPIKGEDAIVYILAFIYERKSMDFDFEYLESQLLIATRKVKLQKLIKDYFQELGFQNRNQTKKTQQSSIVVYVLTRQKKMVPYYPDSQNVMEENHKKLVDAKWEEYNRIRDRLNNMHKTEWKETINFREYDGDIIHTK